MKFTHSDYRAEGFSRVRYQVFWKCFLVAVICLSSVGAFAQVEIVKWTFPNNPDDQTADGGITANNSKTISAVPSPLTTFSYPVGVTTQSISKDGWDDGANTKYWVVEFATSGYNTLKVSSRQTSSSSGPANFKLQYKIGNSGSWQDVTGGSVTISSTSFTLSSGRLLDVSLPSDASDQSSLFLRWIMTSNSSQGGGTVASNGTSRIDDIIVTGAVISATPCNEPISAASNMAFGTTQQRQLTLNCTTGNGTSRIIVAKAGSPITSAELPVDDQAYVANSSYNTSSAAIGGGYVIYNGTGNAVTVTNLQPGTTYYFAVFEYNCYPANYKTDFYLTGNQTTTCEPTQIITNLTSNNLKDDKVTLNWTTTGFGTNRLVLAKAGSDFTGAEVPVDGVLYTANVVYGSGSAIGSAFAVYKGATNSATITNLTGNQTYYFRVFEYACSPEDYLTSSYAATTVTTEENPLIRYSFNNAIGNENTFPSDAALDAGNASDMMRTGLTLETGAGTFSASGFPTTVLDATKYFSFKLAPQNGKYLTITKLELDERRSSSGILNWAIRSSIDNFNTNVTTFSVSDDDNTRQDNIITLGEVFKNLTSEVEFRIYAYNAEDVSGTWRVDNVQAFGKISQTPLPVSLFSFDAKPSGSQVNLTWATASEKDNDRFEVQRSSNGESFTTIATIAGKGTTQQTTNYTAIDVNPLKSLAYYRLKQVDVDGTTSYSKIVAVNTRIDKAAFVIYPNPAGNTLSVSFTGNAESVSVMNMLGQEVLHQKLTGTENRAELNIAALPGGAYQVILTSETGRSTQKFVKLAQ